MDWKDRILAPEVVFQTSEKEVHRHDTMKLFTDEEEQRRIAAIVEKYEYVNTQRRLYQEMIERMQDEQKIRKAIGTSFSFEIEGSFGNIEKSRNENQDLHSEISKRTVESADGYPSENYADSAGTKKIRMKNTGSVMKLLKEMNERMEYKHKQRRNAIEMKESFENIEKNIDENQDGHSETSKTAVESADGYPSENYADSAGTKRKKIECEERCLTENSEDMWRSWRGLFRIEERCLTEYSSVMLIRCGGLYRCEERCLTENSEDMWRSWRGLYRSKEICLTEYSSGMLIRGGGLYWGSESSDWIIQQPQNLIILSKSEMYMLLQNTLKGSKYQCFLEKDTSLCDNESPIENSDERKLELLKAKNKELDKEMKEKLQRCIHRLNGMRIRKPMQKRQLATI